MQRFIYLLAVLFFLVMSTTVDAQVTGTRLINKATLTSGNYSGTLTYLYTDHTGTDIGIRKVTAPDILDFAGLGTTDVATFGGTILNGNLTVTGTTALTGTLAILSSAGTFNITGSNGSASATFDSYRGDAFGSFFTARRSRGSLASPTALQSGDAILSIVGRGAAAGGAFGGTASGASVDISASENFTTTQQGSHITFATSALGTTTRLERLRINATGFVGIGTTTPATTLDVSGTITTGTLLGSTTISGPYIRTAACSLGTVGFSHPNYGTDATYYAVKQDANARTTVNGANSSSGGVYIAYDNTLEVMRAVQGSVVFNEGSNDRDFRIEGDTDANLFALDAGLDRIGIGTATPNGTFHLSGSFASSIRATAASGNITATDNVVTGTGAITLTLPTAVSITGREYILKNIGGVTMTAGSAGGTIDAATTQAIISGAGVGSSMKFKSDGTNWIIIQ